MQEEKKTKQAFEAKRANLFRFDPNDLVIIGLDTEDGPEHPLYDDRVHLPLDQDFVNEIRALGIIQAVVVRKNGDKAEVVAGRQRVRAAREVNNVRPANSEWLLVPAVVDRGSDDRMRDISLSENEYRVNDTIEVKVKKLERYLASGRTEHEAAQRFKVSVQTIKNWLLLLEAGPEVKQAVEEKKISPTAAIQIAKLPRESQAKTVEKVTSNGSTTIAKTNATINKLNNSKAQTFEIPSKKLLKAIAKKERSILGDICAWATGMIPASEVRGLEDVLKSLTPGADAESENV